MKEDSLLMNQATINVLFCNVFIMCFAESLVFALYIAAKGDHITQWNLCKSFQLSIVLV